MAECNRPSFPVGANVLVVRDNALLLGRRIKNEGAWGVPGGHLEQGESILEASERELKEETGMRAERFEFINIVNDYTRGKHGTHYVHIGIVAVNPIGEPVACEPDVCSEWKFFPLDALPKDIFIDHKDLIQNHKDGIVFAEV